MNKAIPALLGLMLLGVLGYVLFDSLTQDDAISTGQSGSGPSTDIEEKAGSARRESSPEREGSKADSSIEAEVSPRKIREGHDPRDFHAVVMSDRGDPVPDVGVSFMRRKRKFLLPGGKPRLSDERGRVTVSMSARRVGESKGSEQGAFAWRVDGLFQKPLWFDVDDSATAASPQELKLPPFGWIELEFRGENDRILEEWVDVYFVRQAPTLGGFIVNQSKVRPRNNVDSVFLKGRSNTGSLRLGPVALGQRLRGFADGKTPGGVGRMELELDGPVHDSEVVRKQVRWKARPVFSGRALDATGEALANAALRLRLGRTIGERETFETLRTTTDDSGRFQFHWPETQLPSPDQEAFLQVGRAEQSPSEVGSQRARREVSENFRRSDFELGDVRLRTPPLIGAGMVVDGNGAPVAGAIIDVFKKTVRHDARIPDRKPQIFWGRRWGLQVSPSDEQGLFRIHGFHEGKGVLGAEARKEGMSSGEYVEFEAGATNVLIVMKESGGLEFNLVTGRGMKADDFLCLLDTPGEKKKRLRLKSEGSRWRSGELEPGPYRLRILSAVDSKVLLTRSDIVVEAGKIGDLGDLDPIENLNVYVLEFVDRHGQAVSAVQVSWMTADPKTPWGMALAVNGECRFLSKAPVITATIKRQGYATRRETLQPGRRKITLQSGLKARINVIGAWPDLEDRESIWYHLKPVGKREGSTTAVAGSDGGATIDLGGTGPHVLTFRLMNRDGRMMIPELIRGAWEAVTLDVRSSANQQFDIRLPEGFPAALEKARKRLKNGSKAGK